MRILNPGKDIQLCGPDLFPGPCIQTYFMSICYPCTIALSLYRLAYWLSLRDSAKKSGNLFSWGWRPPAYVSQLPFA